MICHCFRLVHPLPDPVFALRLLLPAATGAVEASPMPALRAGQRLIIHAGPQPGIWNELGDLLQADFSMSPTGPGTGPLILLELMPPLLLGQALRKNGYELGVYLPAERPLNDPMLGHALPPKIALDLIRKLHTLALQPAVLADASAVTDPAHYVDLVSPFAAQLYWLEAGATDAQLARVAEAMAMR